MAERIYRIIQVMQFLIYYLHNCFTIIPTKKFSIQTATAVKLPFCY